ncbi:MAG: tyrosine-type recombinase/integrase [Novosphingobium sp.]
MTIKGLHIVSKRRPGKPVRYYIYAWRGGPQIRMVEGGPRPKLGPNDIAALKQAQDTLRTDAGSFGRLIEDWRGSPEWAAMATSTRAEWGRTIDLFPKKWTPLPVALFDDPRTKGAILKWRDGFAATPRRADYVIQVLRAALAWGRTRGRLERNICDDTPKLYAGGERAEIIWEPHEREIWQQARQSARDAVNLACLTGLRRGDLVKLPLAAIGEHAIVWKTSKGKIIATIPLYPKLRHLLENLRSRYRADGVDTVLVSALGKPRSPAGLTGDFIEERKRLGLPAKRLHDCRGTFATELMLVGMTDRQIADIMGWSATSVERIRKRYVDQARVIVELGRKIAR